MMKFSEVAHRANCLYAMATAVLLSTSTAVRADVTANVSIWHGYDFYYPNLSLSATPAPVTFHWMESASGALWKQFGSTNGGNGFFLTNNLQAVIYECTNGLWKLYLNRGDASEQLYFFKVSIAGVTTNELGDVNIGYPLDGSSGISNQPTYEWTGPVNLPQIQANSTHDIAGSSYFTILPGTATSWTPGTLTPGPNTLFLNYYSNSYPGIVFTTPTNSSGTPLAGWAASGDLHSYKFSSFTVANTGGGNASLVGHFPFDDASNLGADTSGKGNSGSEFYTGSGTQFPQFQPNGIAGGAVEFDGFNGLFWDHALTNVFAGSYSVSLWVKTTQSPGTDNGSVLDGAGILDADGDPMPMVLTGSRLAFDTGYDWDTIHSSAAINSGAFRHLVITYDALSGIKSIYIDGVLDTSSINTADTPSPPSEVDLGYSYNTSYGFIGLADDLQVYDTPLSASQVEFLYHNPGLTVAPVSGGGHTNLAHYRFDDAGNLGLDDSGQNNHFNSGSSWGTPLHEFNSLSAAGLGAVHFYGWSSMTHTPPNPAFTNITSALAGSFSVSLWLNTDHLVGADTDDAVNGAVVVWSYDSGADDVIPVSITGNKVAFHTGDEFGSSETLHSTSNVADGTYHHIVVTRNRQTGEKKIYVDGVLDVTATGTTRLLDANDYYFSLGGVAGHSFDGLVDDFQVYSGVLSASDVAQLYHAPGTAVADTAGGEAEPVDVSLELSITRNQDFASGNMYLCFPRLGSVNIPEITEHSVESPNAKFKGTLHGSSSENLSSLASLLAECTNGVWKIYINKGDPQEQVFTFSMTLTGIDTNLLKAVIISSPLNGSVGVPANPSFTWSGPEGFNGIFAQIYEPEPFHSLGSTNFPGTATNWPSPPILNPGTNALYLSYHTNNTSHATFSTPATVGGVPLRTWTTALHLNSDASVRFVVSVSAEPVQLSKPTTSGGNLKFEFLSQSGHTYTLQSRTNLTTAPWVDGTNVTGTGNLIPIEVPIASGQEYFRIRTQ